MRILVDLDGTIAHFGAKFHRLRLELFPHLDGIPHPDNQTNFNMWEGRSEEEQNAIRTIMNYNGFYRDLEPMEGAVEAIHEMIAEGHEVRFLSAPWTTNPTCAQDKYDWIAEHFGEEFRENLFLVKHKDWVSGDILFDDKYPIPHAEDADWVQVFITQPYNVKASGYRISGMSQWREAIASVYEDAYRNYGKVLRDEVRV